MQHGWVGKAIEINVGFELVFPWMLNDSMRYEYVTNGTRLFSMKTLPYI